MATYCGTDGEFWAVAGTETVNVRSWSINLAAAVATGAHSSSEGWTDACAGPKSWTGSVEVYDDTALAATPTFTVGADVGIQLWDGYRSFDGSAFITDITYNCDIEGGSLVTASCSFQGYGVLTIAAAAPT